MGNPIKLNNTIDSLFPEHVRFIINELSGTKSDLLTEEAAVTVNYSDKRLRDFCSVRLIARELLQNYEINNFPILPDSERAPLWPSGIVGTITHCKDLCGVAISQTKHYRSLGFDMENIRDLNFSTRKFICTYEEEKWLLAQPEASRILNLLLIFSIKESLYKCIYQAEHNKINFKTFSAIPVRKDKGFELKAIDDQYRTFEQIKTRYHATDSHVFTFCYL